MHTSQSAEETVGVPYFVTVKHGSGMLLLTVPPPTTHPLRSIVKEDTSVSEKSKLPGELVDMYGWMVYELYAREADVQHTRKISALTMKRIILLQILIAPHPLLIKACAFAILL